MQKSNNARRMTGYLIVSVIGTWVAAYVLAWVLPSQLVARPGLAQDATDIRSVLGTFALFTAAVGALELFGLAVIWRAPRLAVGRVVVLIAGVVTTVTGLFLLNGGALQSPEVEWSTVPALVGAAVIVVFIVAGVLACAAALFSDLPGASIAERMTVRAELDMGAPRRELMLLLTAALAVAWIWTMATLLSTHAERPFDVMQFGMPFLAGILAGAWRSGKPDRQATVGLASGAGAASSWLFLAVMMLGQYYRFNPVEYVFWWGLTGAILGAIGYGAWLLARRLLRPRHSHAPPAHAH